MPPLRSPAEPYFNPLPWLVAGLVGLSGACNRTVVLGSECPDIDTVCSEPDELPSQPGSPVVGSERDAAPDELGGGATDADSEDTPQLDGALSEELDDAGQAVIGQPLVSLAVYNPSFERGGGLPGDVVLVSLVGTLLPLPPVTWALTTLPNWYACLPLAVSSESREPGDAGAFQSGGDYVSFVANGTTVRQTLAAPMAKGTSYAFVLDVISRSEGSQNLFVEVRGARQQCGEGIVLGRSRLLRDSADWQSTCVSFVASDNFTQLLLGPGWEGVMPSPGARLLIDNLRQVESCAL